MFYAEDNDLNAELATIILEDAGMTVTRASDGKEVVDFLKTIWNYYDYASGYFGVINSSLQN